MNPSRIILTAFVILLVSSCFAQNSQTTTSKKDKKKNLTVKEWNKPVNSKTPVLDHVTTYNDKGQKIEEIEYANYGVKERVLFEYDENGKCIREVEYNDRNKVTKIKKYEYNTDGTKKKQYNYYPNGNLESVKDFEYVYK
jgi:antitoxin component YwqK of YwqJK toxin-antitoxin module